MKKIILTMAGSLLLFGASPVQAVFLDPYDNALVADGFYGMVYGTLSTASSRTDAQGNKIDTDYTSLTSTVRAVYYKTLADLHLVFQAGIPFGEVSEKKLEDKKSSGLGDIWFGPGVFLYSNEKTLTHLSYWLIAYAPTGSFDRNHTYANLGWNHWYYENQLAFSQGYDKFIFDMVINHYTHSEEKENRVETPDRLETEMSLGYQLTESFLLGLNYGAHWDLDDYKVAGVTAADSGAKRYELGLLLGYNFTPTTGVTLRWNHDISSENDLQGDNLWLRFNHTF